MSAWTQVNEATLQQGDYLPGCLVPIFDEKFFDRIRAQQVANAEQNTLDAELVDVEQTIDIKVDDPENNPLDADVAPEEEDIVSVNEYDLIIMTQSCDLENTKTSKIVVCTCGTVDVFTQKNPHLGSNNKLNEISSGRMWGLYLLVSVQGVDMRVGAGRPAQ